MRCRAIPFFHLHLPTQPRFCFEDMWVASVNGPVPQASVANNYCSAAGFQKRKISCTRIAGSSSMTHLDAALYPQGETSLSREEHPSVSPKSVNEPVLKETVLLEVR